MRSAEAAIAREFSVVREHQVGQERERCDVGRADSADQRLGSSLHTSSSHEVEIHDEIEGFAVHDSTRTAA